MATVPETKVVAVRLRFLEDSMLLIWEEGAVEAKVE